MIDVALAACDAYLNLHPDDQHLRAALEARGLSTTVVSWTYEGFDWSKARCCLPRNTWDYPDRPSDFREWIERTANATQVWNPEPVLRWNMHKAYLLEMEGAGIPILPTALFKRGAGVDLDDELARRSWGKFVLKPAIGATSREACFFARDDVENGQRMLERLLEVEDVLLQPFLPSVQTRGEVSLVYLEGSYSHAVLKRPRDGDWRAQDEFGGSINAALPRADEVEVATRAMEAALKLSGTGERLLYARVDLVRDPQDSPCLSELELIEPTLFLRWCEGSAEHLAGALFARLAREG